MPKLNTIVPRLVINKTYGLSRTLHVTFLSPISATAPPPPVGAIPAQYQKVETETLCVQPEKYCLLREIRSFYARLSSTKYSWTPDHRDISLCGNIPSPWTRYHNTVLCVRC